MEPHNPVSLAQLQRAITFHALDKRKSQKAIKASRPPRLSQIHVNEETPLLGTRRWLPAGVSLGLIFAILGVVLTSSSEQVFRKILATNMYNYRWFLAQLLSILSFLFYSLLCAFNFRQISKLPFKDIPFKSYIIGAFLDTVHSTSLILAIGILPGPLSVLLPQAVIPLTIIFRLCSGEIRCKQCYWAGCSLALGGLLVSFIPDLTYFQPCLAPGQSYYELVVGIGLVFLGVFPAAAASLYRKSLLTHQESNIYFMNFLSSCFQVIFTFVLAPAFLELQYLGSSYSSLHPTKIFSISEVSSLPPPTKNMFYNFTRGLYCLFGRDLQDGDVCQELGSVLLIEFIIYLGSILLFEYAVIQLLFRCEKEAYVHYSLVTATALSCLVFQIPTVQLAFPAIADLDFCISVHFMAGTGLTLIGLVFCKVQEDEKPEELNIWDTFEPASVPLLGQPQSQPQPSQWQPPDASVTRDLNQNLNLNSTRDKQPVYVGSLNTIENERELLKKKEQKTQQTRNGFV